MAVGRPVQAAPDARLKEAPSLQAGAWAAGLFGVVLLALFHQTAWSMVAIWLRSETFAHGLIILPICLWLMWRMRDELRVYPPKPVLWVIGLMVFPAVGWLLAWMVDVLVVQQLALVTMLLLGVWAILGHRLTKALAFPLLFLYLAVPMGESLVLPMMDFTATSTVWLIQLSGVPVYREGLYFSLPSGHWSVVEACSGVRYIIASLTLGILYAYLTYRSLWRRLAFVFASLLVPVVANTVRAYFIVMLGHWSDMTIATGVDHLIYGWVFFGIVMFLLFWVGAIFREDRNTPAQQGDTTIVMAPMPQSRGLPMLLAVAALALVIPIGLKAYATGVSSAQGVATPAPQLATLRADRVNADEFAPPWQWRPYNGVPGEAVAYQRIGDEVVAVYIQYDDGSEAGAEIVGSGGRFVENDDSVRLVGRDRVGIQFAGRQVQVHQAELMETDGQMLAWSWYRIGNVDTSNDYAAKLAEAQLQMTGTGAASYRIVLVAPMDESVAEAAAVLKQYLERYGDALDNSLRGAAGTQR